MRVGCCVEGRGEWCVPVMQTQFHVIQDAESMAKMKKAFGRGDGNGNFKPTHLAASNTNKTSSFLSFPQSPCITLQFLANGELSVAEVEKVT